jgi:hypothetical protein
MDEVQKALSRTIPSEFSSAYSSLNCATLQRVSEVLHRPFSVQSLV